MKNLLFAIVLVLVLSACRTQKQAQVSVQQQPATLMDSISLALGYDLGLSLEKTGVDFNAESFLLALQDLKADSVGGALKLTESDKRSLLQVLQEQVTANNQPKSPVVVGEPAPEISLPTPEGETLSLSDLKGKIVLVDFWASWCRPCRMENPNVVKAYEKYKDRGFEILGVSLDRNKDQWLKAIEKDGLTWHHVSDLQFWQSEAAKSYGVHAIPYTVLVDEQGNVIAERLRGQSLEQKLSELLD